jgi:hypothetical protein
MNSKAFYLKNYAIRKRHQTEHLHSHYENKSGSHSKDD